MSARCSTIIRSPIGRNAAKPATGGSAARAACIYAQFRWRIFTSAGVPALLDHQEAGLHAIVRDPVPHHACSPASHSVLELHFLTGVQRPVGMLGAESAGAVVEQMAIHFLRRGIGERQLERPAPGMTPLGPAILGVRHTFVTAPGSQEAQDCRTASLP